MTCLATVTDGDVHTWSILNFEVAEQETLTLFEAYHRTWVEGLALLFCQPPACTLSVDDRCFAFTLDYNVALILILTTDEYSLVVRSLAIFHELQGGTCAKVEYGFDLMLSTSVLLVIWSVLPNIHVPAGITTIPPVVGTASRAF